MQIMIRNNKNEIEKGNKMKKSTFTALLSGTVSTIMFSIGMCMVLIDEWNMFKQGIMLGVTGLISGIITVYVWRRMEHKPRLKLKGSGIFTIITELMAATLFSIGVYLCIVLNEMVIGIGIGVVGIIMFICLIPLIKGLRE